MNTGIVDEYREQLRTCARSLAIAKNDVVKPFLPDDASAAMVAEFTNGNLGKRFDKLKDQFEFMEEEFPELEDWMTRYVKEVPLRAYDVGTTDSLECLRWIREQYTLLPEQVDFVVCHESRVAVEEVAREKRMAHIRFQDLLTRSDELADELESNADLWIHLNPVHVWATFRTEALLGEGADLPATVVFFPYGSDIRTAVLEDEGAALIAKFESIGACHLDQLRVLIDGEIEFDRDELLETLRDLAEMGLLAFG